MAIAYVGVNGNEAQSNGSAQITCSVPTVTNGDVLLLEVTVEDGGTVTTPSGWTLVGNSGSLAYGTLTYLYTRIASSEPASYTITVSAASIGVSAIIAAYSGVDTTTPIDASVGESYNYQGNNNRTSTGITNGSANNWAVFIGAVQGNGEPVVSATGYTSRFDTSSIGGWGVGSRLFDSNGTKAAGALSGVAWAVTNDQRSSSWFITLKAAAGGGSNYNQSAAGTMGTLSATLVLKTGKALSGVSGSYSATLVRLTGKALAGTSGSSSAELAKSTTKSFAGTMGDLSATLSAIKTALVAVSGTAGDLTGSITRQVNKALVGVSGSVSGTLVKLTSKAFSGADGGLSGALNASAGKFVELAGTVGDLAGALARQTLKSLSGATDTVSGAISKQINKALSATSGSISGTLSSSVYKVVELAGAAGNLTGTLTRSIAKSLAGTVGSVSGSIAKAISKSFSGTMGALSGSFTTFAPTEYLQSIAGSISSITGSVTMTMVFRRAKMKAGYAIRSIINGGRRLTD